MIFATTDLDTSTPSFDLSVGTIEVWRVLLDRVSRSADGLHQLLSPDERDRASRFYFERDRRRFTVARGSLRAILSGYLKMDPQSILLDYGPQGKPFLASAASGIKFNVAHSGELALIAVSLERELGVDVEFVRSLNFAEQIPERFFSQREAAALRALPAHLAEDAFFACWTRKEAYIKARGGGLSIPLDSFEVSLAPGKPAALLEVRNDPAETVRWDMADLHPASGYRGALVARGKDWRVHSSDWTGNTR